jgi:hypothetical protein
MSLLKEIGGHPEYQAMLKAAEKLMPDLPEWDPATDNTEEWKQKSAMRHGFQLCLAVFRPK